MRAVPLALSATLLWALAGCVAPSDGTPSSADLEVFGVTSETEVRLDDTGFEPDRLALQANTTLTVVNAGTDLHGVRQAGTEPDRRIETGDLVPGEAVDLHLTEPGSITLVDPRSGAELDLEVGDARPVD